MGLPPLIQAASPKRSTTPVSASRPVPKPRANSLVEERPEEHPAEREAGDREGVAVRLVARGLLVDRLGEEGVVGAEHRVLRCGRWWSWCPPGSVPFVLTPRASSAGSLSPRDQRPSGSAGRRAFRGTHDLTRDRAPLPPRAAPRGRAGAPRARSAGGPGASRRGRRSGATPCSVTTAVCWNDVTGSSTSGTIVDTSALGCQDRSAIRAWPPVRVQRADDEVGLAAEAGVDARRDAGRVRLAEQVDLQRGVDRRHRPAVAAIRAGEFVVSVRSTWTRGFRSTHAVQLGRAVEERRRERAPRVERTGPVQLEDTVGEHLRPDRQPASGRPAREASRPARCRCPAARSPRRGPGRRAAPRRRARRRPGRRGGARRAARPPRARSRRRPGRARRRRTSTACTR